MNAHLSPATHAQENLGIIDSLLHPLALPIRQLLTRSGRQELNQILIDDEENILQALAAGVEIHSLYHSGERLSNVLMQKLPSNVMVHEVTRRTCKKLFENDKVSRVFAIAHQPPPLDLERLATVPRDIVALENLTIAGNIGSIIRTSVALGAGGVVLLNADPVDIYDRRIIRASRGYIFSLPIVTATTAGLINFCRRNGLPMLVMVARAENFLDKVASFSKRLVIIFGSEKDGCSQALMDAATLQVRIPTNPSVESLNVSTAAGIMLYNRNWFNNSLIRK